MKTRRFSLPAFFMAILLAAAVSFSSIMCLAESFSMPCTPKTMLISCLGFSLLASAFLSLRRNWMITALAALFYGGMLWFFRQELVSGLETAVYYVTENYSRAYSTISVVGTPDGDCTGVLTILALPLAWITAWIVNREGSVILGALICAPILVLCLTIVDLAPTHWLIVLTGALLLQLLTNGVRERDPHQGGQLAWLLLLPVAAVMAILILLSPPENYSRAGWITQLQALSEQAVGMDWDDLRPADLNTDTPRWSTSLREVDLSEVGPRPKTGIKVLEYTADTDLSYLRGVSLGVYEDNAWKAVPQENFLARDFDGTTLMTVTAMPSASVTIRTVNTAKLLYTPYHMTQLPTGGQPVDDAYVDNTKNTRTYTVPYAIGSGLTSPAFTHHAYSDYVNENYTAVPEALRVELEAILAREGLTLSASPMEAAAAVSAYLKNLAVYDLNTPAVPDGEDFVLYFLTQSQQGYCVHFATAAAMLLRTMDIPARYVTGYSVSGPEGQTNPVTTDDAHAWVEYYVNGIGWMNLDPTPPDLTQNGGDPMDNDTPSPNQSDAPDAPSQPEQTDIPGTSGEADAPGFSSDGSSVRRTARFPLWLLPIPILLLLICLRRQLILTKKRRLCLKGHPNRRCLALWRQLAQVSRITGNLPEERLIVLAEKARFSQHTMTREEYNVLAQAAREQTEALKKSASPVRRLWQKYGPVVY